MRSRALLLVLAFLSNLSTAEAGLELNFSEAADGGVKLSITGAGMTTGAVGPTLNLNNLSPAGFLLTSVTNLDADSIMGTGTINGTAATLTSARLNGNANDLGNDLRFVFSQSLSNTTFSDFNYMAVWNVGTLAFSDLGAGNFEGTSSDSGLIMHQVTVTPEPNLALVVLLVTGGFGAAQRRRRVALIAA